MVCKNHFLAPNSFADYKNLYGLKKPFSLNYNIVWRNSFLLQKVVLLDYNNLYGLEKPFP